MFSNIGGVTAWHRTAKASQSVFLSALQQPVFIYVDDAFWAVTDFRLQDGTSRSIWFARMFGRILTDLAGLQLDAETLAHGPVVTDLGMEMSVHGHRSEWRVGVLKGEIWISDFREVLVRDSLSPQCAAEVCRRMCFLNCRVFNRIGRALVRPLKW